MIVRAFAILSFIASTVTGFAIGVAITVWREIIRPTKRGK